MKNIESLLNNIDSNVCGYITENNTQVSIEFKVSDLSLEKSLSLYSKIGSSLENVLGEFFTKKDFVNDKTFDKIQLLKSRGVKEQEIISEVSKESGAGDILPIISKIAIEIIKNESLTKFLSQDLILNSQYVSIKKGENAFVKLDPIIHDFNKAQYKKFLLPLWLKIIIGELKVFMSGL